MLCRPLRSRGSQRLGSTNSLKKKLKKLTNGVFRKGRKRHEWDSLFGIAVVIIVLIVIVFVVLKKLFYKKYF